jgi:hypothetical protein
MGFHWKKIYRVDNIIFLSFLNYKNSHITFVLTATQLEHFHIHCGQRTTNLICWGTTQTELESTNYDRDKQTFETQSDHCTSRCLLSSLSCFFQYFNFNTHAKSFLTSFVAELILLSLYCCRHKNLNLLTWKNKLN